MLSSRGGPGRTIGEARQQRHVTAAGTTVYEEKTADGGPIVRRRDARGTDAIVKVVAAVKNAVNYPSAVSCLK